MIKISFLGGGNMAGALIGGAVGSGTLKPEEICVYDINDAALSRLSGLGVTTTGDLSRAVDCCDMLLLAVKPNVAPSLLSEISGKIEKKALISIAAGFTIAKLRLSTDNNCRILRVMPNTPALVGCGAAALCSDTDFTEDEKQFSKSLFDSVGIAEWMPESLIDAVVGVSGSGPAYVYMFIEALADGGVMRGLPRAAAYRLAAQTVMGAGKMVLETGRHPGDLKDMVCSPAGTTIDAVASLENDGFRAAVINAVDTAAQKSLELSRK